MAKREKKVVNGKNDNAQKVDLRDLLEVREKNPFGTRNKAEFESKIIELPIIDLQKMAVNAGISASGTAPTIRESLRKEFTRYVARNQPIYFENLTRNEPSAKLLADVEALLASY